MFKAQSVKSTQPIIRNCALNEPSGLHKVVMSQLHKKKTKKIHRGYGGTWEEPPQACEASRRVLQETGMIQVVQYEKINMFLSIKACKHFLVGTQNDPENEHNMGPFNMIQYFHHFLLKMYR